MLFEVSVIPVGGDSTCIEGGWDEAIALVRDCHRAARRSTRAPEEPARAAAPPPKRRRRGDGKSARARRAGA